MFSVSITPFAVQPTAGIKANDLAIIDEDDSLRQKLKDYLLIDNARGMFRWVQVWLNIVLGLDERTIQNRQRAERCLKELKDDVAHSATKADKLLESGCKRLWKLHELDDSEEWGIRTRLFQIVLCAFESQTLANLSVALRIRDDSYHDYPTPNDVQRLCANFLEEDSFEVSGRHPFTKWPGGISSKLRFIHQSARQFVLSRNTETSTDLGRGHVKQFSDKNNHATVSRLYIERR